MQNKFQHISKQLNEIILGKKEQLDLSFCCLLAQGHLLIEDIPGMGKTVLAHALATVLGLDFSRVQFTSDMLPADIVGVSVFDASSNNFHFHKGPVFSSVVLADEINRASPKTQSALLEAMEERQVTVDGETYKLPDPFFVIATQNPQEQTGTFPLPESQLDRFFMRLSLGYPDRASERQLLQGEDRREQLLRMQSVASAEQLKTWQKQVDSIKTSPALLDYVQDLIEKSRNPADFTSGVSPRAGLDLVRGARAWAMLHDRDYVIPEDVQDVLPAIIGHRLSATLHKDDEICIGSNAAYRLLEMTPVR